MKIIALSIVKANSQGKEPWILGTANDVKDFSYFQRATVKEMILFVSRLVGGRTPEGNKATLQHEEYLVHAYNRQGLVGVVLADKDYPERAAYSVINKILDDYERKFGDAWALIHADCKEPLPLLNDALRHYQDPTQADKIIKVQRQIDEVAEVAHNTINSLLDRGEKLDVLMDKSTDLSENSKIYMKNARKLNRCCVIL